MREGICRPVAVVVAASSRLISDKKWNCELESQAEQAALAMDRAGACIAEDRAVTGGTRCFELTCFGVVCRVETPELEFAAFVERNYALLSSKLGDL